MDTDTPPKTYWLGLVAVFLLALTARAVYLLELRDTPFFAVLLGDGRTYDAWAREIAAGDWFGGEVFYQAPLYPYFLAAVYKLFGAKIWVARLAQALLGSAACVLLAAAGRSFFSARVGLVAGALLALYPPALFFDGLIQKASLALFLLTLILALLGKSLGSASPGWPLGVGLALGALALVRENALILGPLVGLWLLLHRWRQPAARPVAALLALILGLAAVLAPVGVRNRSLGGELLLTTSQLGPNFFIGNHLEANGRYRPLRSRGGDARVERLDATDLAESAVGRKLTPGEVSDYWLQRSLDYIRSHPSHWARLLVRKWLLVWHAEEVVDTDSIEAYGEASRLLRTLGRLWHFGVLAPLAAAGVWLTRGGWRRLWLLWAMTLALAGSVSLFYVLARYRYPMVPLLALFAAAAAVELAWRRKEHSRSSLLTAAAVLAIAGLAANWPLAEPIDPRATTYLNLGVSLSEEGDHARAVTQLERALRLVPGFAPAHHALGQALLRQGRPQPAELHFRKALELDADFAPALGALSDVLARRGDLDGAIAALRRVVDLEPRDAPAHNSLGFLLTRAGRIDEALAHLRQAVTLDPGLAAAHNQLGNILASRGQRADAEDAYRRALALDPELADAHYKLGRLLAERDGSAAVVHLGEAARLAPGFAEGQFVLGLVLERLGRVEEAREAYRRAVDLAPGHREAAAAIERLEAGSVGPAPLREGAGRPPSPER